MAMPEPYRAADLTIKKLNRKALKRFERVRQVLTIKFDELNAVKAIDNLYAQLDADNRTAYHELFVARYKEVLRWLKRKVPDEDTLDEMADMYLAGILGAPDGVTHYIYDTEVPRKRDRLIEAVESVNTTGERLTELQRALRFWAQMSQQYADTVTDAAMIEGFKTAGVKKVRWHTQKDQRVCHECDLLDGKIFWTDKLPPKPHWRCRCWLTPVTK